MATKKQTAVVQTNKTLLIPVSILIAIAVTAGVMYYRLPGETAAQKKDLLQKKYQVMLSPQQEFEIALDNTIAAQTVYAEFENEIDTRITAPNGVSQMVETVMKGHASGSTDGKTSEVEYSLFAKNNPSKQVVIGAILSEDGSAYIKGPATAQKWVKYSKEEFESLDKDIPVDASMFGLSSLESLFEQEKLLWKNIDRNTIRYTGESQKSGIAYKNYVVDIATPSYVEAIKSSDSYTDEQKKQIEEILGSTIITAEFEVDTHADVISHMKAEFKNLKQIVPEEYKQAGLSSQHDSVLTATFSRYNVATNIKVPDEKDVVLPNANVKGATTNPVELIEELSR